MYPPDHAVVAPDRPAVVMASSGATVTYAELDDRSARLATLLHRGGARTGDTVVLALPNDLRWGETAWACWRSGLVLAPVDWHLTAAELTPLMEDAVPRAVVTSAALLPALRAAVDAAGAPEPRWLVVGADAAGGAEDYDAAVAATPRDPDLVDTMGGRLLFSSGTTGRPKPFRIPPAVVHPSRAPLRSAELMRSVGFDDRPAVYLSTGPAYHAAPIGFLQSVHQLGGTVVLMERFDAEGALAAIERHGVTHSQWVPTMFVRLLRLPDEVKHRYDLSTHRAAVHGAAPCPPEVKRAMIDWWGPIVYEYYGSSEGYGRTSIDSRQWLAHPGSVGRTADGTVRTTDPAGRDLPPGEVGAVWFVKPDAAEPVRDDEGGADLVSTPGWGSAGDVGYLDADGYLYLTGRDSQVIISGGVNIYPREVEDVLALHPSVADIAVLGVPDAEFGEQVKAVVQLAADVEPGPGVEVDLVGYCRERLAHFKCPRSVDFVESVPRSAAGKVLMAQLRSAYWPSEPERTDPALGDTRSRIPSTGS